MDEAYISTKFYQHSLNKLGLVPKMNNTEFAKLESKYAKVVYVPFDKNNNLLFDKKVDAGLHLVNNHPVKFLEAAQTDEFLVEAVGRSRYNVVNFQEKVGLAKPDPEKDIFKSSNAPERSKPFRVEHSWASSDAKKLELEKMINKIYSAPLNHSGEDLYKELSKTMDIKQLYTFLAFNHIIRNGDISDEYFWFTQKNTKTGQVQLRILPQDGDDLLKGSHMFPFNKEQIKLIARDKLHIEKGFIFNFEDPLFRAIRNDPYLYHEYLKNYKSVANTVLDESFLEAELRLIENELAQFKDDEFVLKRGILDEIGKAYDSESFSNRAKLIKESIESNANTSLNKLESGNKLNDAKKMMLEQKNNSFKYQCAKLLRYIF